MSYTEIKRLRQNNTEFVPITLAEAVVVNTSTVPGLTNLGITTLDKVLKNTLTLVGNNAQDITTLGGSITTLTGVVNTINQELANKQDKLTAGVGISISQDVVTGNTVISVNHTLEIYRIITIEDWLNTYRNDPKQEYENIIFLVPQPDSISVFGNAFKEYICVLKNNAYQWEEFGTIQTSVDLSGYVTTTTFNQAINSIRVEGVFAEAVQTSTGQNVVVSYTIPSTIYDSAVNINELDEIVEAE